MQDCRKFLPKNTSHFLGTAMTMLVAGFAILFAAQSARAEDHKPITTCGTTIDHPGKYYLANDLLNCPGVGISITASHVLLELRGHTIQGTGNADGIDILGGSNGIYDIEIAGHGTVTGTIAGISLQNAHWSCVHDLVAVLNRFGMTVNSGDFTSAATATATASTDNQILSNVLTANAGHGISVNGGKRNQFIGNNTSNNGLNPPGEGILLYSAEDNVVRGNTAIGNNGNGIDTGVLGTDNRIEDNTALGNSYGDLNDGNSSCTDNDWKNNTFVSANPSCLK